MEEINQLLTIEIDQKAVNLAIEKATEARRELDALKQSNKELAKAEGDNTKAITQNNIEMKKLSGTIRENERLVLANEKAQISSKGSIEQLRNQLSAVTIQWKNLSKEERENTEEGQKLAKQKKQLTDLLKAEEKATGDTRRNVGNYTDSIKENNKESRTFLKIHAEKFKGTLRNTKAQIDQNDSLLAGSVGFKKISQGINIATAASLKFLATPLGAVIGALGLAIGTVVGAFSLFRKSLERTEKGQAALSKVTEVFSAIMNGVLKVLEPLATTVMQGVADGFDAIGRAASKASGFLEKGLRFFGLDGAADKVDEYNKAIVQSVKDTRELADAQVELNKIQREFEQQQLDFQNRAEKLRQIRDDEAKSIDERIKANEQLGKVLDEQLATELKLAERQLEISQLRAKTEGESKDNLDAIADAQTKILEIEERITGQRSEQLVNVNSLKKEQKELAKQAEDDRLKAIEAEEKEQQGRRRRRKRKSQEEKEEARQARAEAFEDEIEQLQEQAERVTEIEVQALKDRFLEGLISKEEYEQGLTDIENAALAARQINAELARENALNSEFLTEQERVRIISEAEKEIANVKREQSDAAIAAKLAEREVDIEVAENKRNLAELNLSALIDIFGKESAAGKATASFQALISTYQGAAASLKEGGIFGIIQAALITAAGLASVAKINSAPEPQLPSAPTGGGSTQGVQRGARRSRSFADGGYTGDGFGSADSSGYKPAGIVHEGEYVVKKSMVESPMFSSVIGQLESYRLKGYASGGFVGRSAGGAVGQNSEITALRGEISELAKRPIITRISDIDRVKGQAVDVQNSSTLS